MYKHLSKVFLPYNCLQYCPYKSLASKCSRDLQDSHKSSTITYIVVNVMIINQS